MPPRLLALATTCLAIASSQADPSGQSPLALLRAEPASDGDAPSITLSADTPGTYFYDPATSTSTPNTHSFQLDASGSATPSPQALPVRIPVAALSGPLTLKLFVRPDPAIALDPRRSAILLALRSSDPARPADALALAIAIHRSPPPHSYLWLQAFASAVQATHADSPIDLSRQGQFDLFVSHPLPDAAGSIPKPLSLNVEHATLIPYPPAYQWTDLADFTHLVSADGDWAPALQAAIDASPGTVFIPTGLTPTLRSTVEWRGDCNRLFGATMKSSIQADAEALGDAPAFRISHTLRAIALERLHLPAAEHASTTHLLCRDGRFARLLPTPSSGHVFLENIEGTIGIYPGQKVRARHFNPESKGEPELTNSGGQFWALGLKTEYASTHILNRQGGQTEIFGGLIYPVHEIPPELPMFQNEGGGVSLVHAISQYNKNHETFLRAAPPGAAPSDDRSFFWLGGRMLSTLYRSDVPAPEE
jgi:hypothetical protein